MSKASAVDKILDLTYLNKMMKDLAEMTANNHKETSKRLNQIEQNTCSELKKIYDLIRPEECNLCGEKMHNDLNCGKYNTVVSREERLEELKRCRLCAKPGCGMKCGPPPACVSCEGKLHIPLLCRAEEVRRAKELRRKRKAETMEIADGEQFDAKRKDPYGRNRIIPK